MHLLALPRSLSLVPPPLRNSRGKPKQSITVFDCFSFQKFNFKVNSRETERKTMARLSLLGTINKYIQYMFMPASLCSTIPWASDYIEMCFAYSLACSLDYSRADSFVVLLAPRLTIVEYEG